MYCGTELEVHSGAGAVAEEAYRAGLLNTANLHDYHCRCEDCCHDFDRRNPWTAQRDCTCSGEFITKPLVYDSAEYHVAIDGMGKVLQRARPVLSGTEGDHVSGNHVHVERANFTRRQEVGLCRIMLKYKRTLERVAGASHGEVRDYNQPIQVPRYSQVDWWNQDENHAAGNWLNFGHRHTVEFRLWNCTRMAWRMHLHIGLSVAMARAALADHWANPGDGITFAELMSQYANAKTMHYLNLQLNG